MAVITDRKMLSNHPHEGDIAVQEIRAIEKDNKTVDPETSRGVGIAMLSTTIPHDTKEREEIGADKYVFKNPITILQEFPALVKEMITLTEQRQPRKLRQ